MCADKKIHVYIFQTSYPEVKPKEKRFLNSGGKKICYFAEESTGSVQLHDDDVTQFSC